MFVLADPDVFSGPVGQVLSSEIETSCSGELLEPLDHMRCAVQHALQAVLGVQQCHGKKLAQGLRVSEAALASVSPPGGRLLRSNGPVMLFNESSVTSARARSFCLSAFSFVRCYKT